MVRLTVEAELKDTFKNERWGHNLLLSLKVIWIVDNKCLSSFFLFNQRRHVFAQIRQRRRQRRRPTSILYLSLSLSANDHLMSRRLGLEEDQLESKTKWLREDINWKKTFSFGHCPNDGGGVYPCPNFLALFLEVHFWSIKRVYFFKNANVLNF